MPNMLSNLINTGFSNSSYPGQEQLLSKVISGRSNQSVAPMQAPKLPATQPFHNPNQGMLNSLLSGNQPWQKNIKEKQARDRKKIEEQQARESVGKGLAELVAARKKSGKQFLPATQRIEILSKHMPLGVATQLNSKIDAEEQNRKPKYRDYTKRNKDGSTTRGVTTQKDLLENPIVDEAPWEDVERGKLQRGEKTRKDYTDAQWLMMGFTEPKDDRTNDQKNLDRYNLKNPNDQKTMLEWQKKGKGSKEDKSYAWRDLPTKEKSGLLKSFEAAEFGPKKGFLDAQDYAAGYGAITPPEGYTSPEDFEKEASAFLASAGRPAEEMTAAISAARQKYGTIDTLRKWREDIQRRTVTRKVRKKI